MDLDRAIRESGLRKGFIAEKLGMDAATFAQKLHGWKGRKFSDADKQTMRELGVNIPVAELFPEPSTVAEAATQEVGEA